MYENCKYRGLGLPCSCNDTLKNNIRTLVLVFCFIILNTMTFAQEFEGMQVSTYAGNYSVGLQPASLASTPYSFDLNLISASANGLIKDLIPSTNIGEVFYSGEKLELASMLSVQSSIFWVNTSIKMPSFSIKIDDKSGAAFNWEIRAVGLGNFSKGTVSLFASDGFNYKTLFEQPIIQSVIGVVNSWQDFSISYGRNIYDKGIHQIDVGAGLSYIVGGASGFVQADDLVLDYDANTNTLNQIGGTLLLNYNSEIDDLSEGQSKRLFNSKGYDIKLGIVYKILSKKNLSRILDRKAQPNYLLKFSASVGDLGKIFFKSSNNSASYELHLNQPIDASYFNNITSISDLSRRLQNIADFKIIEQKDYSMRLPTVFNINVDWSIWNTLYANVLVNFTSMDMSKTISMSPTFINYQFSGRWEKAKYGFYFGTEYNKVFGWGSSISMRYSIIYLGVSNFLKFSKNESIRTPGLMFGLRVPLLTKSDSGKRRVF